MKVPPLTVAVCIGVIVCIVVITFVLLYTSSSYQEGTQQEILSNSRSQDVDIRKTLKILAAGKGDITPLTVTYSDMHGLWGGLQLTISGAGNVTQEVVRTQAGEPRKVSREELTQLVTLLVRHEAWEQRVREREPFPDESRAYLRIMYGNSSTEIWEWHNDSEKNQRIDAIASYMKQIAWKAGAQ